jgi:tungstate transport system ATP-binding protein
MQTQNLDPKATATATTATMAARSTASQAPPVPVLRLQHAGVRLGPRPGVQALVDLSFTLHQGERLAVVGANGCGKSTLLRLLHGLLPPDGGTVWSAAGLTQAMVFQRPRMLRLSAQTNVALGLWLAGLAWGEARAQALHALQQVGLEALARRPAHTLSGGQQQRLALARAWATAPRLLLLDEPTSSLDPHAKREVEALVQRFAAQDPSMTLVFASHNLGQVKRLATRVIYLENGRLLADLPVQDFFVGTTLQTQCPQADLFVKGELV